MATSEASRRHARIDVSARVKVTSIDAERDTETGAICFRDSDELCANLSVGGAFIRSNDPPATGRRVLLEIHLPDGASIEAIGRVAWTQRVIGAAGEREAAGAGIEFVSEDGEARNVIERYLERARKSSATS